MAGDGDGGAGSGAAGAAGSAGAARGADGDGPADPRAEMLDAPPFLSWPAIYLIVLGALVVEVALGVALTVLNR